MSQQEHPVRHRRATVTRYHRVAMNVFQKGVVYLIVTVGAGRAEPP